ncbi:MAG: succinylarginine dihydrolase [Planctomycetota bacterium]|nr:MAG: succinylarginine dihydrolase [Planctomycetota bacterium]
MIYREVNFDGLVGPTHNYGGLAFGNIASQSNLNSVSNPRSAALQGLKKMKYLMDLGIVQAVLPPQPRPDINFLRSLGYKGSVEEILGEVGQVNKLLLHQSSSASSMWVANAATITSSNDSSDKKVHITPANLISHNHRSIECEFNYSLFNKIFYNTEYFSVEKPLPSLENFSDEGAANFIRLSPDHSTNGINVFVYGKSVDQPFIGKYPARQSKEACESIFRNHLIESNDTVYIQQSLQSINSGVFHNDVISVGNENVLLYHDFAFEDKSIATSLNAKFKAKYNQDLFLIKIRENEISLKDAVKSYFFNSQLITLKKGEMILLAPFECKSHIITPIIERIIKEDNPIKKVEFLQLKESMKNGGGPACLRLRVLLNEEELKSIHQGVMLTEALYEKLVKWVNEHYRDQLLPEDLMGFNLYEESKVALTQLSQILNLDSLD